MQRPYELQERRSDSVLHTLDPGVLAIVVSFLNPRDLLHLSMCSKTDRENILHDHVVTSGLISGGQAKRTATQVVEMALPRTIDGASRASIHLPTPIRLLRLINGTRCEYRACSSAAVTTICPHFGLFLCWDCFLSVTTEIDREHEVIANEKRIARLYRRKAHVLKSPFRDASGEIAGPIVSWDVASGAMANEEVEALLKQADQAWSQEKYDRIRQCFRDTTFERRVAIRWVDHWPIPYC